MTHSFEGVLQAVEALPVKDRFLVAAAAFLVISLIAEGFVQLFLFIRKRRDS